MKSRRIFHQVRSVGCLGLSIATLALWNTGCGGAAPQDSAERQEIERLRAENQQLAQLRTENQEVQRLRKENQEISKLRAQYQELVRLRKENDQLRGQLAKLQQPAGQRPPNAPKQGGP